MQTILISRTDAIGDVILTLPLAGLLRERLPGSRIVFLCTGYTKPIVECCEYVDEILDWNTIAEMPESGRIEQLRAVGADTIIHVFPRREIARAAWKAGIKNRIGTTHRLYHFRYCNRFVGLGRKKSPFHEAVLNSMLAQSLLPGAVPPSTELWPYYGLTRIPEAPARLREFIHPDKFNLVLHPKSRGSAAEWSPERWKRLIEMLPKERFNIVLTGTADEGKSIASDIGRIDTVRDASGTMTLGELLSFINICDGLVAASTGPLHLAAAIERHVLGLFPNTPPIHPARWGPIGRRAEVLAGRVDDRGFIDVEVESVFTKVVSWLV